ncbi:MAG TPA: hypothetical protein VK142_09750 [Bacillota bacterium]|nr:hypothetical protein [Bacillota bacterium]
MKRYVTLILFMISIVVIVVGLRVDVIWNGIATWGIVFILLIVAAYYTKYIPDKKERRKKKK